MLSLSEELSYLLEMASEKKNGSRGPGDEIMRYGMIGKDPGTTEEKLEKYTGEVDWDYLRPHFESGALLYVDPGISLVEVGYALTKDDSEKVAEWHIVTPSAPHAEYWGSTGARFLALVVSPFVLIQPLTEK